MPEADHILAGDIGGTKTLLGLFAVDGERLHVERQEKFGSGDHATFDDLLDVFLSSGTPRLRGACFDVAGPVVDGECRTTNLPWHLAESRLRKRLGGAPVRLLNDLEATSFGMLHLPSNELLEMQSPARPGRRGNVAVVAAGTGLGEAYLYWDGRHHHPMASEGGHADFAPRTDQEIDLLVHLRQQLGGRVSSERILSGQGIHAIYEFLRERGVAEEPAELAEKMKSEDPAAVISQSAQQEGAALPLAAMDLFFELYGAEAGNVVLRGLTYGGVFVGGGIAPKNVALLERGPFLRGFQSKGRFADFMKSLGVWVSLNPETALLGAANYALHI